VAEDPTDPNSVMGKYMIRRRGNLDKAIKASAEARMRRVNLREAVRAGKVDIDKLIRGEDEKWEPAAKRMKVETVLLMVPGIGATTASEILAHMRIGGPLRLGGLTYRRREELAGLVLMATGAWRRERPRAREDERISDEREG
jgi:hypothetical protein